MDNVFPNDQTRRASVAWAVAAAVWAPWNYVLEPLGQGQIGAQAIGISLTTAIPTGTLEVTTASKIISGKMAVLESAFDEPASWKRASSKVAILELDAYERGTIE